MFTLPGAVAALKPILRQPYIMDEEQPSAEERHLAWALLVSILEELYIYTISSGCQAFLLQVSFLVI